MTFAILFLLLLAASGGWLYSRWAELRDAQARRRAAEMLYVFETRPRASRAARVTPALSSGFGPTLPEGAEGQSGGR